ncbi:MAG: hypothetical protein JO032_01050 [Alphaproteobacteria bacterium]|nr:hypothetical protein [Alphaproteobacteria bacterium]
MSTRAVQETRTSDWHSTRTCSAQTSWATTEDPALCIVNAPMPALVIRFGGASGLAFALAQSAAAAPVPRWPLPPAAAQPAKPRSSAAAAAATPVPAPESAPDAAATALAAANAVDEPAVAPAGLPVPAAEQTAETPAPTADAAPPAEPEPPAEKPPNSNRIELIIDSLPHHELTEPMAVTIDPLGDEMFTATMPVLEVAATGNSIGEALLFLKEQIESMYEDLNRRAPHLTPEQKTTLQMLHTYVAAAPAPRKSRWL